MAFHVIIPARLESARLPRKLLIDIAGKPMLQHTYERALQSGAESVVIATDSEEIYNFFNELDADVCMTSVEHTSGTDRLAEAAKKLNLPDDAVIVNVQGDEPLIPPAVIRQVAENLMNHPEAKVATLCRPIETRKTIFDPHVVKVVRDDNDYALYFSRAPIPWDRDGFANDEAVLSSEIPHLGHIGIYAYSVKFLQQYSGWGACELEQVEKLEQLRVLWHGDKIHVAIACETPPHGVDTEADLEDIKGYI